MNFAERLEYVMNLTPTDLEWNTHGFRGNKSGLDFLQNLPPEKQNRYYRDQLTTLRDRGESGQVAHLPLLKFLASQCNWVTEFGIREGYSTVALLAGAKKCVTSYDIKRHGIVDELELLRSKNDLPCCWQFHLQDVIDKNFLVPCTNLLFIDDYHTYNQVKQELNTHAKKVTKWIAFHDTYTQGELSYDEPGAIGICPAIREFITENEDEWKLVYEAKFNHGLWVIERRQMSNG